MYPILEDAFLRFPMRKKVARLLLEYGLRVDENARIFCGDIDMSPAKIARAVGVDRRVVIETARLIADTPELFSIFSGLSSRAFIRGVAHHLGFEVLEIEGDSHAIGIVSAATAIIAKAGISIRQVVSDDPDIYPAPKLTIILEKRLPGTVLAKLRELKHIRKLSIG